MFCHRKRKRRGKQRSVQSRARRPALRRLFAGEREVVDGSREAQSLGLGDADHLSRAGPRRARDRPERCRDAIRGVDGCGER